MHKVVRNNQILFAGLEAECWLWLQSNQSQSCDWATKHGGYSVEETSLWEILKAEVPLTSEYILAQEDLYDLQDAFSSCGIPFKYIMSSGEIRWWKFVRGRYGKDIVSEEDGEGVFYLHLYHGRKDPEAEMDGWGEDGPWIGPIIGHISWTYGVIHIHHKGELVFTSIETDLIKYGNMYYGDMSLYFGPTPPKGVSPIPVENTEWYDTK